ncbi:HEAT repeat domain-containing protein [Psychrobacillus sp. FSL K6-2684]|uniref:HEAT repeat domain-containing protein n=1 Tax=unclassified Psychrobacillus TaxID=2636677 RepID=UPI0030FC3D7A
MYNNSLKLAIENERFDETEIILEEISKSKDIQAIPLLIGYLRSTENALLRNSIALTLSDTGNEDVVQPLIDVINDPKTLGYRGTLLYALEPFDCSAHIETLVYHLINGNYEVQAQAYQLIKSFKKEIPNEVLLDCISNVREELNEIERKVDLMSDTLETLCALKKTKLPY